MSENVIDVRIFSLDQCFDGITRIDHDMQTVTPQPENEFSDWTRLIKRFSAVNCYAVIVDLISDDFADYCGDRNKSAIPTFVGLRNVASSYLQSVEEGIVCWMFRGLEQAEPQARFAPNPNRVFRYRTIRPPRRVDSTSITYQVAF